MTRSDLGDEELARAAKAGNVDAFGVLVRRFQGRIYGLMLKVTRSPVVAEDLAQEAFLRAFRGLRTYDANATFAPWMYRIGVNLASDWASDARRSPEREWDVAAESAPDGVAGPEERAVAREAEQAIHRQILELPRDQQRAVLLRHMMGLSYAEVAEATGQPLGTVKTNLFRARARLKVLFDNLEDATCVARK